MRTAVVATAICFSIVGLAVADGAQASIRKPTNIPAQNLGDALKALANTRDFQILYVADVVGAARTQGANGDLTPSEALARLLRGTGLTYKYLDDNTVTIIPTAAGASSLSSSTGQEGSEAQAAAGKDGTPESHSDDGARKKSFWSRFRLAQADQGTSSVVVAQETWPGTQASETTPTQLEEVVVNGFRSSLKQSIAAKRQANAIVDTISAEDIGKFPDKNVAESLAHVPGITVDREYGQGELISIRGTDPSLNRTLLNGQSIASSDWFILNSPGRSFNYTLIAPEVVGRVEVYKTPEARLDEGALGGSVIMFTRRPFDLDSGKASASFEYNLIDRGNKGAPSASGMYSWKNSEQTFGIIGSALYSKQQLRRDGFETFGYKNAAASGLPASALGGADPASVVFPNAVSSGLFQQERERKGGTIGLQARPLDSLELNLTALYVEANYDNYNQSRYFFNGASDTNLRNVTAATVRNNTLVTATLSDGTTLLDAISRVSTVKTDAYDLKADWQVGGWGLSSQLGTTKSTGGTQQQYFLEFQGSGGYTYDIGGAPGSPATVRPNNDPTNPASLPLIGFAQLRQQPTSDKEDYIQADLRRDLHLGAVDELLVGAKYRKHRTSQDARLATVQGTAGLGLAQFAGGGTPSGFLDGLNPNAGVSDWTTVDRGQLEQFLKGVPENNALRPFPAAAFDVKENVGAAYAQLGFKQGRWHGNAGLRYVDTDQTSSGASGSAATPTEFKKSYKDWLPAVNVAFDLRQDVVLRLSASKVIARANFSDLSPFTSLTETVKSGSGGNPNLNPYRAKNYDLSAEWYLGREGLLAVTAFYKDVESFILRVTTKEPTFNVLTGQIEPFDITRPRNGAGGSIKGFELAYQNVLWRGFGLQANYTYSEGSTAEGLEIPFNSKNSFNITPFYENRRFSTRVTYSYRSKYFREIGRNGIAVTNDTYGELDAALGVKLTEQIELTAQAQNLLDETQYEYAGVKERPAAVFKNGRRYFVGARMSF